MIEVIIELLSELLVLLVCQLLIKTTPSLVYVVLCYVLATWLLGCESDNLVLELVRCLLQKWGLLYFFCAPRRLN